MNQTKQLKKTSPRHQKQKPRSIALLTLQMSQNQLPDQLGSSRLAPENPTFFESVMQTRIELINVSHDISVVKLLPMAQLQCPGNQLPTSGDSFPNHFFGKIRGA